MGNRRVFGEIPELWTRERIKTEDIDRLGEILVSAQKVFTYREWRAVYAKACERHGIAKIEAAMAAAKG